MTRDELWSQLVKKHPALLSRRVQFSPEDVKKFFDYIFKTALEKGEFDTIKQEAAHTPHPCNIPDFLREFLPPKT
jgi:hypothetical protein